MGDVLIEGELEFDFSKADRAERFGEESRHGMSHCMKAVDFLVEWPDALWLVEAKDPSISTIPDHESEKSRRKFIRRLQRKTLFHEDLGPKAKDTFLYLHLTDRIPEKPLKYFVLIAMEAFEKELLGASTLELKQASCLVGPIDSHWETPYIADAAVFDIASWNHHLNRCPVRRRKKEYGPLR